MKRSAITLMVLAMAALALATGGMMKTFTTHYKVKSDSELGQAKCSACHTKKTGGALNPYGKELQALGGKKVDAAVFAKAEAKDSDGDGMKNGDEIKKGRNPGVKN